MLTGNRNTLTILSLQTCLRITSGSMSAFRLEMVSLTHKVIGDLKPNKSLERLKTIPGKV
jgi:hypothetical protein